MRIFTLLALFISLTMQGQIVLTQSEDPETISESGVACFDSETGYYPSNSFWRSYDLTDFGVTEDFIISELQWGQGAAYPNNQLILNIYVVDNENLQAATQFDLVASTTYNSSPSDDLTLVSTTIDAGVSAGSIIAFEINAPDNGGGSDGHFYPGFNLAGENAPSYIQAVECGLENPAPVANIPAPDQYVMNVIGEEGELSVSTYLTDLITIYPTATQGPLYIDIPAAIQLLSTEVYAVNGQLVYTGTTETALNLTDLSEGTYLVKLFTDKGILTQHILKK